MKKAVLLSFMALTFSASFSACTPAGDSSQEGLVISAPVVRAPMGGQTTTAGYFKVTNHTEKDDILLGVESPEASRVEIHVTEDNNGIMSMKRVPSIAVKAGETVSFAPGGYHLMIFGVNLKDGQKDIQLTLTFENGPDLPIIADIVETTPGHHSGHY